MKKVFYLVCISLMFLSCSTDDAPSVDVVDGLGLLEQVDECSYDVDDSVDCLGFNVRFSTVEFKSNGDFISYDEDGSILTTDRYSISGNEIIVTQSSGYSEFYRILVNDSNSVEVELYKDSDGDYLREDITILKFIRV